MHTVPLIVFDEDCGFCSYWVDFIIRHNKKNSCFFVGLDTELGHHLIDKYQLHDIDSIVFIDDNIAKVYSNAILNILKNMDKPYCFLYYLHVLPLSLLDYTYKLIASSRHSFTKTTDVCIQQSQNSKKYFLYKIEELKEIEDDK